MIAPRLHLGDAPHQGKPFEEIDLNLGDVEPADMLGVVEPPQAVGAAPGPGSIIAHAEQPVLAGVGIVADQGQAQRARRVAVQEVPLDIGEIQACDITM